MLSPAAGSHHTLPPANLPCCVQLDNAWVFAGEEGVADTVKAYLAMEKKLLSYLSPDKRKTAKPTDISGMPARWCNLAGLRASCVL